VNGIFFNQGSRLLRGLPAAGPGVRLRPGAGPRCSGGWPPSGWATRWTRTPTWGAINSAAQLAKIRELSEVGEGRGARSAGRRRASCRSRGFWFPPHRGSPASRRRTASRAEEIFGPVLSVLTFRTPGPRRWEKANNNPVRAVRRRLDRQGVADLVDGLPAAGRRGVGPTRFNKFRPVLPVSGGYKESGLRPGRRPARPWRPTSMSDTATATPPPRGGRPPWPPRGAPRLAVRKTYKLYIGGAFPRLGERKVLRGGRPTRGGFLANAAPGPPARTRGTRWVAGAARAFAGWSAATAYNRGQVLYRVAELLEGRRAPVHRRSPPRAEGLGARQGRGRGGRGHRPLGLVRGPGADKIAQVRGASKPGGRGPFFNFSLPEPTGVGRGDRPRGLPACSASSRSSRPPS